jgi:predicted phosphodiesterase
VRFLIISDMHGNADALAAVLDHAAGEEFDELLNLGDLVGYGASPNEVVEALGQISVPSHTVRGNHDKVAAGIDDGLGFNPTALTAARWTAEQLTPANLEHVRMLPQGPKQVEEGLVICHGTPFDEDYYLLSVFDAEEIFATWNIPVTFFGHTHVPAAFACREGGGIEIEVLYGDEVKLELEIDYGVRYLINPGSVGQPRDRDPRASYMIYDSEEQLVLLRRVEYSVTKAQERILEAGLPRLLADRLALGY